MRASIPPRIKGRIDRLRYLLGKYRVPLAAVILIGGVFAVRGGVPEILIVIGIGVIYGVVPALLVGLLVVTKLFPDTRKEIIELSIQPEGVKARTWKVPSDVWDQREQGTRPPIRPESGADAIVTSLDHLDDLDKISIEGCNQELADPVEMVGTEGQIEEIHDDLVDRAEELDRLRATVRTRALEIQRANIHSLLAAVESGTQMDPGSVSAAMDGIDDLGDREQDDEEERSYQWESRGSKPGETGREKANGQHDDLTEVDL